MKADTWMPLYIADYARDTLHLTTEQHGAYMLLLMACWTRGGVLPPDDGQLAGIARLTPSAWRRMSPVITAFFQPTEGGLRHKRVTAEHEKASRIAATSRENGRKGGRPPSQKEPEENPAGSSQVSRTETPAQVAPPSPSPRGSVADATAQSAPSDDPDAEAWALAKRVLTRQGGLSDKQAGMFFGKLLKDHKLSARDVGAALLHAEDAGTHDPQSYLTASAQNLRKPRNGHASARPSDEDTADRLTRVWSGAAAQAGRA